MLDLALCQQFQGHFVSPKLLIAAEAVLILSMHQVKIEIIYAAGFQLGLEQRPDILGLGDEMAGQLVGQDVAFPRMAAGQAFPEGYLTHAV